MKPHDNVSLAALIWFESALDRYGYDLQQWPAHERARAETVLAESPVAQRLLYETRQMDHVLATWKVNAPPTALRQRLLADFAQIQQRGGWLNQLRLQVGGLGFAIPALAAALVLGFVMGARLPQPTDLNSDSSVDALSLLQYNLDDESW